MVLRSHYITSFSRVGLAKLQNFASLRRMPRTPISYECVRSLLCLLP
jgi:hypothetical protein